MEPDPTIASAFDCSGALGRVNPGMMHIPGTTIPWPAFYRGGAVAKLSLTIAASLRPPSDKRLSTVAMWAR